MEGEHSEGTLLERGRLPGATPNMLIKYLKEIASTPVFEHHPPVSSQNNPSILEQLTCQVCLKNDTCVPFGLHFAPSIFDNFASALHWVLEHNHAVTLLHYLDNFVLLDSLCTCQDSHVLHVQSLPGAGHASCHRTSLKRWAPA